MARPTARHGSRRVRGDDPVRRDARVRRARHGQLRPIRVPPEGRRRSTQRLAHDRAVTEMLALVAALLFVALNGFFVAAEFALVKVRTAQLAASERKGDVRATVAQKIISRLDRYLGV